MVSMISFMKASVTAATPPEIAVINPQNPLNPSAKDGNFVFYTNTTSVGHRFNATLWVFDYGTPPVFTWQVKLNYNPDILNITRAWNAVGDPAYIFTGRVTVNLPPAFGVGTILIGDCLLGGSGVTPPPAPAPAKLATLEFEILASAPSGGKVFTNLDINNSRTCLVDDTLTKIPGVTKTNGYYEFNWLELGLDVKPSEYVAVNLETFNISVWLNNVTVSDRLVSLKFKLRYNATLLNVTKATEGTFMPRFGTTAFNYSFGSDNVTIQNQLKTFTSFPNGNGTIATITLQGIYQDPSKDLSCPLELIPMQFLNDSGNPITYSPSINGSYTILHNRGSYITIKVAPASVVIGSNATISGTIKPSKVGVYVTIYHRLVGQSWANLTTVKTGPASDFAYNLTTSVVGTFEFKANWTGDASHNSSESGIATLVVKKLASAISIDVNPSTVTVGANVTISGAINVARTGVNVTIYYGLIDGAWRTLPTVQTNSSQYAYVWTTTEGGTYELYASWLGDNVTLGAESPKAALTVKKFPSSITINVNPSDTTVVTGSRININGSITAKEPKIGVDVTIYCYQINVTETAEKIALATVKTDTNSRYNYTWTATKRTLAENETFAFYAVWPGDKTTSGNYTFFVPWLTERKIPSIITINVDNSTITIGSNVTISGAITPAKASVNVIIYYREKGTTVQSSLLAKTSSEGHYNYTWKPMKNATFELYAWWGGDENTYSNESDIVTIKVNLIKSSITINVNPEATTVGSNITISGGITPAKANASITIYYRLNETGVQWMNLTTVKTDPSGKYTYTWTTNQTGTFELEAQWLGDNLTEPAKSEIEIVKVEEPFSLITYVPYILGGAAIIVIALAVIYLKKIKKRI
jgi:hypothetical protein